MFDKHSAGNAVTMEDARPGSDEGRCEQLSVFFQRYELVAGAFRASSHCASPICIVSC